MADAGAGRVVVCRVGTDRFALPVAAVREVIVAQPLVRIPGVPRAVRGLANVRGTLVSVVSGPRLLGLPDEVPSPWLIVLALYGGRVGIEVDEIEDLHAADSAGKLSRFDLDALVRPLLGPEPTPV